MKETDRLHALVTELRKIGAAVTELPDGLHIHGDPTALHGAEIDTYDDHRMAMCFGMAGARLAGDPHPRTGLRCQDLSRLLGRPASNVGVTVEKA